MRANSGVWGAESAIPLLLRLKPHSVHSLPWNTLLAVALICMAAMVQVHIQYIPSTCTYMQILVNISCYIRLVLILVTDRTA